jgi:hypothetical protein
VVKKFREIGELDYRKVGHRIEYKRVSENPNIDVIRN